MNVEEKRRIIRSKEIKDKILIFLKRMHDGEIKYDSGTTWIWATWFDSKKDVQFKNSVVNVLPKGIKERTIRALMFILDKQGLIEGCHCGCRGDYEITDKGLEYH